MDWSSNTFSAPLSVMPYFSFVSWRKSNFQVKFAYTISWWKFGCSDGWAPESTTTFGCDVKMRSMQDEQFSKTCVGSFIIWWSRYCEVTNSIFAPYVVVSSLIYQSLDFILNSPSTIIKWELDSARASKVS